MILRATLYGFAAVWAATTAVGEPSNRITVAEVRFAPDLATVDTDAFSLDRRAIARTLDLFGDRRDVGVEFAASEKQLLGTLATQRRDAVLRAIQADEPIKDRAHMRLSFDDALSADVGHVRVFGIQESVAFCPWTVEAKLEVWSGSIVFAAGIENSLPTADDLTIRLRPNADVPHHKSLIECTDGVGLAGSMPQSPAGDCTVFLVASDQPIKPITMPEIRSALLAQGKGSGAFLLPTALSGTAICAIRLRNSGKVAVER